MSKKGDEFHRIVTSIERILNNNLGTSILSPSFEVDKITKQKREHDIIVMHQIGHETIKMAIECKDLTRKVDAPIIEAFQTKLNDTNCNKGVIVSSSGFTEPAISKAKHYNISCLTLSEVEQFPWILTNSISSVSHEIRSGLIKIITDEEEPQNPKLFEKVGSQDLYLEKKNLDILITNALNNVVAQKNLISIRNNGQPDSPVAGIHKEIIKIIMLEKFYVLCDSGRLEIRDMTIEVEYETKIEQIPISFKKYDSDTSQKNITNIGIASCNHLGGDIVFLKESWIYFVPNKNNGK